MEIQNYDERKTNNNDQQNEHIIIVPHTQDVPNHVEENESNSLRDNFFSSWPIPTPQRQPHNVTYQQWKKTLNILLENLDLEFFSQNPELDTLTPLSLKINPTSVPLKTETDLWNL